MKGYLFDENLPARLTFTPTLPVFSASEVGESPTDSEVWAYARQRRLVIVTKDADFADRIISRPPPPWVVHLKFGNLRRREYHAVLARFWPRIEKLLQTHKLLNVHADCVEAIG